MTSLPIEIDINEERQSIHDIIQDYYEYIPTKRDNHHVIHQNNLNKFNKAKLNKIKRLFRINNLTDTQLQMDEDDLFADLTVSESFQKQQPKE